MASTPRARGKKSGPAPNLRPWIVPAQPDQTIQPQDYLRSIGKLVRENQPLEHVIEDFAGYVDAADPKSDFYDEAIADAMDSGQGQVPRKTGKTALIQFTDVDSAQGGLMPQRISPHHNFPFWDPRGHMIDLLAEPRDDNKPRSFTIVEKIVRKAEDGDLDAAKELFDRVIGKSTQHVEMRTEQHINHYDVSCDPACFDVVVREDEPGTRKVRDDEPGASES